MAKRSVEKLILICLDSPIPDVMLQLADEGRMPAFAELLKRGTYASNCLATFPTSTLSNWASIATGAWPGTHGVISDQSRHSLKATPLWEAAAADGRSSILINCPAMADAQPAASVQVFATPQADAVAQASAAPTRQADAAVRLMETRDWTLFFLHDSTLGMMYESPSPARTNHRSLIENVYQSIDGMLARILDKADRQTLVVLTSDHGALPDTKAFGPTKVLSEADLLALHEDGSIDWPKTKAAPAGDAFVFINLKGRDPHGVVEPAAYDSLRDQIIDALMACTTPETGDHPVAFALRREDARIFGLYGDHVGDIVYCLEPPYGHNSNLPTARTKFGSLHALLLMAGPNIREGKQLDRSVWLVDVAPTICYLMDIPFPETMEGAIIYQALQDPNFALTENARLEANFQRLKRAYDAEIALTHTYNR